MHVVADSHRAARRAMTGCRFAADRLIGEARLPLQPLLQQSAWARAVPLHSATATHQAVRVQIRHMHVVTHAARGSWVCRLSGW